MKRYIFIFFLICINLFSQKLEIEEFQTDVYSKNSNVALQKISISMIIIGRYVDDESYKVVDALNVVVGSFFAEDLFTSSGKEGLKKGLISYTSKKHGVEIDDIYIKKFYILNSSKTEEIINAMKKEGCCQMSYKKEEIIKNVPKSLSKFNEDDDDIIIVE